MRDEAKPDLAFGNPVKFISRWPRHYVPGGDQVVRLVCLRCQASLISMPFEARSASLAEVIRA
jgi:hypothetical protein